MTASIQHSYMMLFDTIKEFMKESKMIACIISVFMHSVVVANPTEQTVNNGGNVDGSAKDSKTKDEDEEDIKSPNSHEFKGFSFPPSAESSSGDEKSDDFQASKIAYNSPPQDDLDQPSSTLPSHNLTLDAISIRDEKVPVKRQEKIKQPRRQEFKHVKKDEDLDMKEFIKQVVYKQFGDTPTVKFFDAAIVYDEEDYSAAVSFRDDIKSILEPIFAEDVRIELFDSEQFAQSKILVVKDVVEKCSVVLLYLTEHFSSSELKLFVEESIAMTRLGYSRRHSEGSLQEFALKPVHTEPKSQRKYQIPVGLLSLKGINWYDKSIYTRDQIITLFRTAMTLRKQREAGAIPEFAYQSTFGHQSELQRQQLETSSLLDVTMPPEEARYQQMSHNCLSIPRPRTPPEQTRMLSPQYYREPFHHIEMPIVQDQLLANNVMRFNVSPEELQHNPYNMAQVGNYNVPTIQCNSALAQAPGNVARFHNTSSTNQMAQPAFENTRMNSPYDANYMLPDHYMQQNSLQQQNVQSPHYTSIPTYDTVPSLDIHHHRHNYHQRHFPGANTQLPYGADPNFRVASSVETNTTRNSPNVTTSYTSNLSTDDVEIDNPVEAKDESNSRKSDNIQPTIKRPGKGKKQIHTDTNDSDSETESSDDEYTLSVPTAKRPKHKVINITGCSVVQLGKGNTVSQPSNPMKTIQKPSRRCKSESQISTRKETVEQYKIVDQCRGDSISEDNLSFTSNAALRNGQRLAAPASDDTNHLNNIDNKLLYSQPDVRGSDVCQGRSMRNTKLNVVVKADTLAKNCEDTANHSPDCNEDELFMSGPLATKNHSSTSTHGSVLNAPFTFSRTRQFPHILRHGAPAYKMINPAIEFSDDSDLD